MIKHYLKIAFRQLLKNKVQYTLSILGIAIGLLCFSMFNYYQRQQFDSYKKWANHQQMASFHVEVEGEKGFRNPQPNEMQQLVENPVAGIEKIGLEQQILCNQVTIFKDNDEKLTLDFYVGVINNEYIAIHSLRTINGDIAQLSPNQVWISESLAKNIFGDENPIGKQMQFPQQGNDTTSTVYDTRTIAAVIKDPSIPSFSLRDVYILNQNMVYKKDSWTGVHLLLTKNASTKAINQRIAAQFPSFSENNRRIVVKTLPEQMNNPQLIMFRWLVMFLASLILISAMINFLKFSIQTFLSRTRELSLRKSQGANVYQLFFLLFTEIIIVLLFSLLTTFMVSKLFLQFYYYYLPSSMVRHIEVSEWELFSHQAEYLVYLFLISSAICLFTIRRVKRFGIISGINQKGRGKHGARNFFLGFQLVICFFFTNISVITFSIYLDEENKRNETLSVEEREHIWQIPLEQFFHLKDNEEAILSEMRSLSSVEDILFHSSSKEKIIFSDEREVVIPILKAGENYSRFMNFPINGRMPLNDNEVMVSNALMQAIEKANPEENNTLNINGKFYRITGTYDLLPFTSSASPPENEENYSAVTGLSDDSTYGFYVKSRIGQKEKAKESIQQIFHKHWQQTVSIEIISMREEHRLFFGALEVLRDLLLILSSVSILIMMLGIYSAITLDTHSRRKEVAIRKINGAGRKVIIRLFAKLYVKLLVIATFIAVPIVYFVFHAEETMRAETHPLLYVISLLIVAGIVAISVWWRIWQIARVNPAEVLKGE